jgi:hypothetical protein
MPIDRLVTDIQSATMARLRLRSGSTPSLVHASGRLTGRRRPVRKRVARSKSRRDVDAIIGAADLSRRRGRALGRRPFGARRCTAKPEIGRSDSSPRVRSARSLDLRKPDQHRRCMPRWQAVGSGTTRGGSGRF